jgi:DNA repair protein RadC
MVTITRRIPPAFVSIKQWPEFERPRERLRTQGADALSARELLALLIETGEPPRRGRPARSAMDLAGDLLNWFSPGGGDESLRRISKAPLSALCEVPGIGPAKAAKVLAALDLGRRAAEESLPVREHMATARDVFEHMRLAMRDLPQEEFHVLLLNRQNELLREVVVTRGTLDRSTDIHARDVFRPALAESAACVVVVHNHPSGRPAPSAQDRELTRELCVAGRLVGIPVHDHVIIGEHGYYSFSEEGLLERL